MKIIDSIEQGSDEWFAARIGSIGGSSIAAVDAKGQGKMRKTLMYRLVGEILSGEKYESYVNQHIERGKLLEDEAREYYSFSNNVDVKQVGMFKYSDHMHFSPDGDIGDGIIEIKCVIPSVHVETIISDKVPPAYRKQCQWGMIEREWCDFISYCPQVKDVPMWVKRVHRDNVLIDSLLESAIKFISEMLEMVEKIKRQPA